MSLTRQENYEEKEQFDSEMLEWTDQFLRIHALAIEYAEGKNLPISIKCILESEAALVDYLIAYSDTDPSSKTRVQEALTKTALLAGLHFTPVAQEIVIGIEILDTVGKLGGAIATGCHKLLGKNSWASFVICPSKTPFELMQAPNEALDTLLTKAAYSTVNLLNQKQSIMAQYHQHLAKQFMKGANPSLRNQLTIDKVMSESGISSHAKKLYSEGILSAEQTALYSLFARSHVYQILKFPSSEITHFNLPLLEINQSIQSEMTASQNYLNETLKKSSLIYQVPDIKWPTMSSQRNTFFNISSNNSDISIRSNPILKSKPSMFSSTMPGFIGVSLLSGIQINPYNIAAYVINAGVNSVLQELDNFLQEIVNGRAPKDERWSEHIGGVFDFTKGGWKSDAFRHRLNQESCTTWLNWYADGVPGKLGCRADRTIGTPGITHKTYFASGYEHIFRVTGYADKDVLAFLFVRCNGKIYDGGIVKLPTQLGTVQIKFKPDGNRGAVLFGDVGVCIRNPKPGQCFRLDTMIMAVVDCPYETVYGVPVAAGVKSPIGVIHHFREMGIGCFQGNGAVISLKNGNGLFCEVNTNDSTPGFEGTFNLIPGEMHCVRFEGKNNGQTPAYIWVELVDSFRRIELPKDKFGTIEFNFRAPYKNEKLIPCRMGICFGAPSRGQNVQVKSFLLAVVDSLKKEVDGHPIAVKMKSPIGFIHHFREMGIGCFWGNGAVISLNGDGLFCEVNTNDSTPGFEGTFNLIPGEMHCVRFEGKNNGQTPAYIWVEVVNSFRKVELPRDKVGIIEFNFEAPNKKDEKLIPCRLGICFDAPSRKQNLQVKSFLLATINYLKEEVDGHPVLCNIQRSQVLEYQSSLRFGR